MGLSKAQIEGEVARLSPFHHDIPLPHGLSTQSEGRSRRKIDRTRLSDLVAQAWPPLLRITGGSLRGLRVLDVACNCGGFALEASRSGADHVLGVDVVDHYLEQASFVKRALGVENVEFRRMAIEELDEAVVGTFDVSLCFGLLYHLENPVLAMKRLSAVTNSIMVVETTLEPRWPGQPAWRMEFLPPAGRDSRIASTTLWHDETICQFVPTQAAVRELLGFLGFTTVRRLPPRPGMWEPFLDGRRGTFLASRS